MWVSLLEKFQSLPTISGLHASVGSGWEAKRAQESGECCQRWEGGNRQKCPGGEASIAHRVHTRQGDEDLFLPTAGWRCGQGRHLSILEPEGCLGMCDCESALTRLQEGVGSAAR